MFIQLGFRSRTSRIRSAANLALLLCLGFQTSWADELRPTTGEAVTPAPPTGPAGGDLTGTYPNPRLATSAAVKSLEGWTGNVRLNEGDGIEVRSGAGGPEISVLPPPVRSWTLTPADLSNPISSGSGGLGRFLDSDFQSVSIPAYLFNHNPGGGNPFTGGVTSLPMQDEIDGPVEFRMVIYFVTSASGGDVRWNFRYSSRIPGNTIGADGEVQVTTSITSSGADRIYRSDFLISSGFVESDQLFIFSLGRLQATDTNNGNVGLLSLRFEYRNISREPN